jgi:hypothetical protein
LTKIFDFSFIFHFFILVHFDFDRVLSLLSVIKNSDAMILQGPVPYPQRLHS